MYLISFCVNACLNKYSAKVIDLGGNKKRVADVFSTKATPFVSL
jgi:hypothetical protein